MKWNAERRGVALALVVLVAAGTYLRFHGLGRPSLWVDEVNHVLAARDLVVGRSPVFPSGEPNDRAILYSKLVALSFRLFGEGEGPARVPSAVFGVLAIPLTYLVGSLFGSRRIALLAAFLVTFSHFEIGWSRLCRMYTVFQVAFLLAVWAFLPLFWEVVRIDRRSIPKGVRAARVAVGLVALALGTAVHILTTEIVAILYVYLLVLVGLESLQNRRVKLALWQAAVLVGGIVGLVVGVLVPPARERLLWVLQYKPAWAGWGMAVDSHYYFWFLSESKRWPLLSFFLIGILSVVARNDRKGWFWVVAFLLPVGLHTFLFSYRLSNYIFHVFPFFLMGAATGFVRVAEWLAAEMAQSSWRHLRRASLERLALILTIGWLPLTVWFRYGIKVSQIGEAGDNGAEGHNNWKGATRFVQQHLRQGDRIMSTLPLTVQYYLGRCEYNLNLANARGDLEWTDTSRVGKIDFYSGAANVGSLGQLCAVLDSLPGHLWVIVDRYRFSKAGYVPPDIASFVRQNFRSAWQDPYETVDVYCWPPEDCGNSSTALSTLRDPKATPWGEKAAVVSPGRPSGAPARGEMAWDPRNGTGVLP
ncbi:MAG: glycosyltransferase family 39 protein [candidate division KSB1 bacterium]|nr:glycosyltransferase family 39 protein [candidate division KSB1 bacterium]